MTWIKGQWFVIKLSEHLQRIYDVLYRLIQIKSNWGLGIRSNSGKNISQSYLVLHKLLKVITTGSL